MKSSLSLNLFPEDAKILLLPKSFIYRIYADLADFSVTVRNTPVSLPSVTGKRLTIKGLSSQNRVNRDFLKNFALQVYQSPLTQFESNEFSKNQTTTTVSRCCTNVNLFHLRDNTNRWSVF